MLFFFLSIWKNIFIPNITLESFMMQLTFQIKTKSLQIIGLIESSYILNQIEVIIILCKALLYTM